MDLTEFRVSPGAAPAPLVDWLNANFHGLFSLISTVIETVLSALEAALLFPPPLALIGLCAGLALVALGWRSALLILGCLGFSLLMGLWEATMETIALVTVAVLISVMIAFPLGILAARASRRRSGRSSTSCRPSRPGSI